MKEKRNKSTKYLLIGTLVLFFSILGASMAYYLARVQGTLNGRAAGTDLDIEVTKLSNNATGDLIPLDNDLGTLGQAALGYENNGACVDINGYSVCQIYRVRVINNGSVPLTINGTVTLSGQNVPNIDCAVMDDEDSITNNNSCMGKNVLASGDTLPANNHLDYYVMVYINNLDEPQYDSGEFNGTVVFTTEDGDEVKGRFSKPFNLVQHITNLYDNAEKSTVTNNEIEYQYATEVNLMKDRLGGTTATLDEGNIRYYGKTPNNYIDIGDRTSNDEVILWRIIGVFDGKVRVIRDESIGSYSWDTSPTNVNDGNGINEWSQADLMKLLNPGYDNNKDLNNLNETITVNNSLYYNSGSGTCYNGRSNAATSCNFESSGLSESVKDKIVDQTIYLGGGNSSSIYTNQAYIMERGDTVIKNPNDGLTRTLSWTGKVGLMYPSDYGYAADLNACKKILIAYISSKCANNNWLNVRDNNGNVATPYSGGASFVWLVDSSGGVGANFGACYAVGVRPVLSLAPSVLAESGNGSFETPYVLAS